MLKAVVFDLDGTLVDSPLCFESIRRELGIPEGVFILEHLAKLDAEVAHKKTLLLEQIEFAAASRATKHAIDLLGLNLEEVITRDDAAPKPDPQGLLKLLQIWDVAPGELLYVGDFKFDIECGKRAGVRTALYTRGQASCETWGADFVFPRFSEFWTSIGWDPEALEGAQAALTSES